MRNRPANNASRGRRGITLLFVISLIVLFLLMGTSFVLLAGQYRKSAVATSRVNTRLDSARSLISRAFGDVVREPDLNLTSSPLRGHSILGDEYGYGVKARVYMAANIENRPVNQDTLGQMIMIQVDDDGNPNNNFSTGIVPAVPMANGDTVVRILDGQKEYLSNNAGEYEGQVLSFVDGPLAGTSVRILAYAVTPIPGAVLPADRFTRQFIIIPGTSDTSSAFSSPPVANSINGQAIANLVGSTVIINRREFSGTGAGLYFANDPGVVMPPGEVTVSVPLNGARLLSPNTLAPQAGPPGTFHTIMNTVFGPDEVAGSTRLNLRSVSPTLQPNRVGESADEFRLRYLSKIVANRPSIFNPILSPGYLPVLLPNSASTSEDYDAADEQNMFLAHNRPSTGMEAYGPQIIPSFYRPQLTRYISLIDNASFYQPPAAPPPGGIKASSAPPDPSNAKKDNNLVYDKDGRQRRDLFIPDIRNPDGSPYYTDVIDHHAVYVGTPGNYQQFPMIGWGDGVPDRGWDVDNDGDGKPDSVWLNIGLPIQTDANGRRLQPLVAYMILDMDSRLNLNFHGNLTQAEVQANRFKTSQAFWGGVAGIHEGQGYGPPEISFAAALANPLVEIPNLLRGTMVSGVSILGRYGSDLVPGMAGRDPASQYKLFTYPDNNFNPGRGLLGNGFSSAMDIHGRISLGVPNNIFGGAPLREDPYDAANVNTSTLPHGMPVVDIDSSFLTSEIVNTAYEMDVSQAPFSSSPSGVETPFSPRELESLLRRYDWDSSMLPTRLRLLLANSFNTSGLEIQHSLTSDSMEVPVPPESLNDRLHQALSEYNAAKFGDWPEPVAPAPPVPAPQPWTDVQTQSANLNIQWMLAPEVMQGRKMDLNFPLGNGLDDNGNGLVDEAEESVGGATAEMRPDPYGRNIPMDYNHNGFAVGDAGHLLARQDFARRLYVLILLTTQYVDRNGDGIVDAGDWFDYNNSTGAVNFADLYDYRRDVAQWVANVVEFRDPDSICTGFEFDLNPWDGWQVDGDINTDDTVVATMAFLDPRPGPPTPIPAADRFVVWGTERPELLLTETFVAHDRRTQDLATETPAGGGRHSNNGGTDNDLDSRLVPNASCFIEMYNPWYRGSSAASVANTEVFPAEFYGAQGVDLRRMDLATGTAPVWRIAILGQDPSPAAQDVGTIRTIYFVRPVDTILRQNPLRPRNRVFFPSTVVTGELQPGQYAVLGSSGVRSGSRYTTYLGRRNSLTWDTELNDTRSITLDTASSQVSVRWWEDDPGNRWQTLTRNNVLAIPIGQEEDGTPGGRNRSLGLTDPYQGYEEYVQTQNPNHSQQAVADGFEFNDSSMPPPVPFTRDEPVDLTIANQQQPNLDEWNDMASVSYDDSTGQFLATGTGSGLGEDNLFTNARVVVLQRLANPLIRWNPDPNDPDHVGQNDPAQPINPYLSVDYLGADVASFNGATDLDEGGMPTATPADRSFLTMERGTNFPALRNLWRADESGRTTTVAHTPFTTSDMHYQSENLRDSLGEPDLESRTASLSAYPWLTWSNRPYVSHLELANVPRGGNGEMLRQFGLHQNPGGGESYYNGMNSNRVDRNDLFRGRFEHLPDFLADAYSVSTVNDPELPPLQTFLDFVEVPSRFVGTDFDLNPEVFSGSWNGTAPDGFGSQVGFLLNRYNPPYNTVSRFRNPGKINLNTVSRPGVWSGVMGSYATPAGFGALADSRRDQGASIPIYSPIPPPPFPPILPPNQQVNIPSDFPFVFRASGKGNFVPEIYVPPVAAINSRNLTGNEMVQRRAQPTLFRAPNPANPDTAAQPMFDYLAAPGNLHADPARNAYFRHDMRQRLGNTTTDKSNVFAIWITIGFFELGDNGTITSTEGAKRHRGFYLIDRSIPVAFEPGKNHNIERIILTSSIIE